MKNKDLLKVLRYALVDYELAHGTWIKRLLGMLWTKAEQSARFHTSEGLCYYFTHMGPNSEYWHSNSVTNRLRLYLTKEQTGYHKNNAFWFPIGNRRLRIKFLRKVIKIIETEIEVQGD